MRSKFQDEILEVQNLQRVEIWPYGLKHSAALPRCM